MNPVLGGSFARAERMWAVWIAPRSSGPAGLAPPPSHALRARIGRVLHDRSSANPATQCHENRIVAFVSFDEIPPLVRWVAAHPAYVLEALHPLGTQGRAGERWSAHELAGLPVLAHGQAATVGFTNLVVVGERLDLMTRRAVVSVVNRALDGAAICRLAELLAAPEGTRSIDPGPALTSDLVAALDRRSDGERLKRAFDLVVGALASIAAAPLVALLALLVKLDSSGPAFFVQERLGRLERPFPCIKLRTMRDDAERLTGPVWASASDARITRIGRFLRKSQLDELPQLLNILRGEMSLVGPRPIRRHFADQLAREVPFYRLRFLEKPGLTGWSQVNINYASTFVEQVEKFRYECEYIARRSFVFDILIMLRTGMVVIRGKGT